MALLNLLQLDDYYWSGLGQSILDPCKKGFAISPQMVAGDAKFDEVEPIVEAITPVPGGVGSVTTSVLMKHVVEAAERV